MPPVLDPDLRAALAARIRYYNEMGIYDFYRRPLPDGVREMPASADEAPEDHGDVEMAIRSAGCGGRITTVSPAAARSTAM